ncbi:MAG TPA: endonuclease/exonuclease/phosphatase family protein [Gemmatimonadales bacterium]|nr:endonuclease/exonuclease/phosphatase family protein [Gemmatimonadales bacterium]
MRPSIFPTPFLVFLLLACQSDPGSPLGSAAAKGGTGGGAGAGRITVYGQNIYVGTDVDAIFAALVSPDPNDDLPTLVQQLLVLQQTDFTARAGGIAAEIDRARPDVVGLNEISRIDVDLTPLGLPVTAHEDFLPELLDAIAARGLHYAVAGQVQNLVAAPLPGVSYIDWDVVLVNTDRVTVGPGVVERNFSDNLGPIMPGTNVIRGWVGIPATINGRAYTVVATHPESDLQGVPGIDLLRAAQVGELVASLPTDRPVILLGDFNDVVGSPMYQVITGAGFEDVWAELRPGVAGLTCCGPGDLAGSSRPGYSKRIDYVFARGLDGPPGRVMGQIDRFGTNPADQVRGPSYRLWMSDHAGLVASLLTPASVR